MVYLPVIFMGVYHCMMSLYLILVDVIAQSMIGQRQRLTIVEDEYICNLWLCWNLNSLVWHNYYNHFSIFYRSLGLELELEHCCFPGLSFVFAISLDRYNTGDATAHLYFYLNLKVPQSYTHEFDLDGIVECSK